jgi:dTDP-4-dehydrorhamnose reductase
VQPSEAALNTPPTRGKALVLGGSGFVGRALTHALGQDAVAAFHSRPVPGGIPHDASTDTIATLEQRAGCAFGRVYLLHGAVNPEACARDPAGTAAVNVTGTIRLLAEALDRGILPIFASSDYVHDGSLGHRTEADPAHPNTEYGRQKLAVETWLRDQPAPWLVARLSKVVSEDPAAHSVLGELIGPLRRGAVLRMATDQIFSPAHVTDIGRALAELPSLGARGLVHVAGPRAWSRYDLACCLLRAARRRAPDLIARIEACSLHDLPFSERRPLNTSLATARMASLLPWRFREMPEVCEATAEAAFGSPVRET